MLKANKCDIKRAKMLKHNWEFQLKLDGFRAFWVRNELYSERQIKQTHKFSHIVNALRGINAVLDGEIALNEKSKVFDVNTKVNWNKAKYYVFDILELNGYDLRHLKQITRQNVLLNLLLRIDKFDIIVYPKSFETFEEGWNYVKENNLEGLIAKDKRKSYPKVDLFKEKRCDYWLKIKNIKEAKLPILDYEEGENHGTFILANGIRISALKTANVELWRKLKAKHGEHGVIEVEFDYLYQNESGKFFQPVLKRFIMGEKRFDLL